MRWCSCVGGSLRNWIDCLIEKRHCTWNDVFRMI